MSSKKQSGQKTALQSFSDTIESLVVAFILAFVFRAFVVEAFVIPTGSMADTLRGAHFHLTCPNCAFEYNFGFNPGDHINKNTGKAYPRGYVPGEEIPVHPNRYGPKLSAAPRCPMCGCAIEKERAQKVNNGDRILVLKYLYQFGEPDTWDVVVFKNPTEPKENYIKRLIGRPGETVQIIDGDVYIDGQIQHKPDHVQDVLWVKCFDNNYQSDDLSYFDNEGIKEVWAQPFRPEGDGATWRIEQKHHRYVFAGGEEKATLKFHELRLKFLLANFTAYNGPNVNYNRPTSDLKLAGTIVPSDREGSFSMILGKYGRRYVGEIDFSGRCRILSVTANEEPDQVLAEAEFPALAVDKATTVSFVNLDHQLKLTVGAKALTFDGPNHAEEWGYDPVAAELPLPTVAMAGRGGAFELRDVMLYRDIHYSARDSLGNGPGRSTEGGEAVMLDEDQYFVCGDNTRFSYDSRFWRKEGQGNGGKTYRAGIVPREYLIGRALFVYWPAGFAIHDKVKYNLAPNVGEMRFIH